MERHHIRERIEATGFIPIIRTSSAELAATPLAPFLVLASTSSK